MRAGPKAEISVSRPLKTISLLNHFICQLLESTGMNIKLFFFAWRIDLINRKQTKTEFVSAVYTLKCVNKHWVQIIFYFNNKISSFPFILSSHQTSFLIICFNIQTELLPIRKLGQSTLWKIKSIFRWNHHLQLKKTCFRRRWHFGILLCPC